MTQLPVSIDGLKTFEAAADLSANQYHFVKLTADNTVGICDTLGEIAYGVLQNKPSAAGQGANVMPCADGKDSLVVLEEAVTAGDAVTVNANGNAILADTSGHNVLGYADQAGASGETVRIRLTLNGVVA